MSTTTQLGPLATLKQLKNIQEKIFRNKISMDLTTVEKIVLVFIPDIKMYYMHDSNIKI